MNTSSRFTTVLRTPLLDLIRGRVATRSWKQILDEAPLPAESIDLLRNVIRRTKLRPGEKADVASDLVSHFLDAREAGASDAAIRAQFGEPLLVARLIRRAKRRQRGVAWQAARLAGWTLLFFVGFYGLIVTRFFLGSPEPTIDYGAVLRQQYPRHSDTADPWVIYEQALERFEGIDWSADQGRALHEKLDTPRGGPVHPEVAGWLEDNRDALSLMRQAGELPATVSFDPIVLAEHDQLSNRVDYMIPGLEQMLMPNLSYSRILVELLIADAVLAKEQGDCERALRDLVAALGLADHLIVHPTALQQNFGFGFQRLVITRFSYLLADEPTFFSKEQLRDFAHRLAALEDGGDLYAERLAVLDVIQHAYTDEGDNEGRLTPEGLRHLQNYTVYIGRTALTFRARHGSYADTALLPALAFVAPTREEVIADVERLWALLEAEINKPLWATTRPKYDEAMQQLMEEKPFALTAAGLLPPSFDYLRWARAARDVERDGLLVAIAATLFHRVEGRWPASIEELTPGYLPKVPRGPWNHPLGFRVVEGEPLVYALGNDGGDDGRAGANRFGQPDDEAAFWGGSEGDHVLWPSPILLPAE